MMAIEVVNKIKEAEDAANLLVREANERAKEIIKNADNVGLDKQKQIVNEANQKKQDMIMKAIEDGNAECAPLIADCDAQLAGISNLDKQKMTKTVSLLVERIVNVNGYS